MTPLKSPIEPARAVTPAEPRIHVVVFAGGRGSGALARWLAADRRVSLTLVINGYDDGASTGRVRRFLGSCLGPSDFRKNASVLARAYASCPEPVVSFLDLRLPMECPAEVAVDVAGAWTAPGASAAQTAIQASVGALAADVAPRLREAIGLRLEAFLDAWRSSGRPFDFSDCAIGNMVFAGCVLAHGGRFNAALADYCGLLGLPRGLIRNVSDGTNAHLVAVATDGTFLPTEEAIVDMTRRTQVAEVFLLPRPLNAHETREFAALDAAGRTAFLNARSVVVPINPELAPVLARAHLIVYGPGTQHSSLFPSYLTRGLSQLIAGNLTALKLLVTNIHSDAEISGRTATGIVERAVYYLQEKGTVSVPTPAVITHYLLNDPGVGEPGRVPLGRLDALDDPRLVRVAYYEEGVSGRHDADKVLEPFLRAFLAMDRRPRVAVVLHDVDSANKLCQTVLEMVRGGIADLPADLTVFHNGPAALTPAFAAALPFAVHHLSEPGLGWDQRLASELEGWRPDHVVLFESSGMYRGEDIHALVWPLLHGSSDAVWGSRRLSVRDLDESYRLRYRHNPVRGAVSYAGSYLLSFAYGLLFGRYITDTLSGARAMRYDVFRRERVQIVKATANHRLLTAILNARANIHEVPVRFVPLSPARVRRASIGDGLVALWTIARCRIARRPPQVARGV